MKNHRPELWMLAVVVTALILLPTATLASEPSRDEIVDGAKKEGKLTYYFGGDLPREQEIVASFKKKYPFIDVRIWEASHSKVYQKLQLEKRAGKVTGDVIQISNPLYFIYLKRDVGLLNYLSPEDTHYSHLLKEGKIGFRYDRAYWTPHRIDFPLIVYRTDKWSKDEAPKSWNALLDPKYKGKIVLEDPRYGEDVKFVFWGLREHFGIDYLEKLAKNEPMFVVRGGGVKLKLVTGERSIAVLGSRWTMRAILDDKGPVAFAIPEEGGPAFHKCVAILQDAPHPNCAKLFLDYFLSKENIEYLRDKGFEIGTRDDYTPGQNPLTLESYKGVWPFDADKFMKEINGFLSECTRIFHL